MGNKPTPTLENVDPKTLVIGTNVRLDARLDKRFVASIRERGVITPIIAHRDGDTLVVVCGQRRTLAAVAAKRATVPVLVTGKREEAERLADQIIENDHRVGLSVADRVAAFEQLTMMGFSAAQIAKKTASDRSEVDAALAVARSHTAKAAAEQAQHLTLDQAAVLAEFDDDPQAVQELTEAAQQGGFAHRAQRLRDERAEAVAKTAAAHKVTESGVTLIERPGYDDPAVCQLSRLKHDGQVLTEQAHSECPGHAAYVSNEWIYPEDPDEDLAEDFDETDADNPGSAEPVRGWVPVYVCTDFRAHGHEPRYGQHGSRRKLSTEMSDAERDAATAERRDVIASNKQWVSAEKVRREWLTTFFARKSAPKNAAAFIATGLAMADHEITHALTGGNKLAHQLLGVGEPQSMGRQSEQLATLAANASEARAGMITLSLLLAAYEDLTGKHSWRKADPATGRYLRFLQSNGYELSTVELRACGETSAEPAEPRQESEPS